MQSARGVRRLATIQLRHRIMLGPRVVEGAIKAAVEGVLGKRDAAFWLSPPLTEMGTNPGATQTEESLRHRPN